MILLPILAYASLTLVLQSQRSQIGLHRTLIRAAVLWGASLVILTEGLSFFQAVTRPGLAVAWAVIIGLSLTWFLAHPHRAIGLKAIRDGLGIDRFAWPMFVGVAFIIATTALVAWRSPPQTWDSLNYHMPRVAHWAQQKAVRHYVTGIEVQNSMPPGAEMIALHFYVLGGGDRFIPFVAWFAMLGSLLCAATITEMLGGKALSQLLSIVFLATLPMGIIQASGTGTDYVLAFWILALASESLQLMREQTPEISTIIFASLAGGLAINTKPTAAAYIPPFAILIVGWMLSRERFQRVAFHATIAILIVAAITGGHFIQNIELYGNPIASSGRMEGHLNQIIDLRVLASNTLKNAAMHFSTPSLHVNKGITLAIERMSSWIGIEADDPRTTISPRFKVYPPTTNEDRATNPLHAFLILLISSLLLFRWKVWGRSLHLYALAAATTFILFSALIKWEVFNSRLHLAFFALYAPLFGFAVERFFSVKAAAGIGLVLVVASFPWLFSIKSRPLIPDQNSYVDSILQTPREELYFANARHLQAPYAEIANQIQASGCRAVGLVMGGNDAEYPLWSLLGAPNDAPRIEWLDRGITSRYADPDFQACAVVCQRFCEDDDEFGDLPMIFGDQSTGLRLFMQTQLP